MSGLAAYLRGALRVQIRCAAPEEMLNRLVRARIAFWGLHRADAFTLELSVFRCDRLLLAQTVARASAELTILEERGIRAAFSWLRHRQVLVWGVAASLLLMLALQHTVWYFDISGSEQVSPLRIIEALDEVGVRAGTWTFGLHGERIENALLSRLPELEQIAVNFYGGRAEILVRDRAQKPELIDRREPCNLVSSATGVIESMEVLSGDAVVQVGQVVLPGQLLISGMVDRRAGAAEVRAIGEVYARTWRTETAAAPLARTKAVPRGRTQTRRTLLIGRKRIKLCFGSGISEGFCDKMKVTRMLTLPGGCRLPFGVETVTLRQCVPEQELRSPETCAQTLREAAVRAALAGMQAPEILTLEDSYSAADGVAAVRVRMTCREMIARESKLYKSGVDAYDRTDDKCRSR